MDKEESWQQFWGSGKVEDYLSYSRCEKEEQIREIRVEEEQEDSHEKISKYF